jgi:hypothetical protein
MLLRLHYACACSNKWQIFHHDNHYGECPECGVRSWPVAMFEVSREEEFTLSNDVKPYRPSKKAYDGFIAVAQTVLPPPAPKPTFEHVPDVLEKPHPAQKDLFDG